MQSQDKCSPSNSASALSDGQEQAFTRIDLMICLLCVAVLGAIVFPALAGIKPNNEAFQCQQNLRQLALAWQAYADDFNSWLVHNYEGSLAQGGAAAANPKNAPWALGWLDWTTSRDNTNILFLTADRYSKLADYLNHSPKVFKCPADVYLSPSQRQTGWIERPRSYSMPVNLGAGNAEEGPWDQQYWHVKRLTDMFNPIPAKTFVFLDEHPDTINDPAFYPPHTTSWLDVPAAYHYGAGNFVFADGHLELHHWKSSMTQAVLVKYMNQLPSATQGDPDLDWIRYHAQRNTK